MMLGTLLMWFGLAHLSAGINLNITTSQLKINQILINFFVAGTGGAIGAQLMSKVMKFFKLNKEKKALLSLILSFIVTSNLSILDV